MTKTFKDKTGTWYGGNGGLNDKQYLMNAKCVAKYCKSISKHNWSRSSCIAMLGNMGHESNVNPQRYQNGVGPGYGLVQWDPRSKCIQRAKKIKQYKTYDTMYTQLQIIDYEADNGLQWTNRGSHYMSWNDFITNKGNHSIDYLVQTFLFCYEGASALAIESRLKYAHFFDEHINWDKTSSDDGSAIDDFLEWLKDIADNNEYVYTYGANHGVSWDNYKTLKEFDCSSFISFGLHNGGGYDLQTQFTTQYQKEELVDLGFKAIAFKKKSQLRRGDILVVYSPSAKHTEAVWSVNGDDVKLIGAHGDVGISPPNQISVIDYWNDNWQWILRSEDEPSSKPRENPTNSNKSSRAKNPKTPTPISQNTLPPTFLKRRRRF